MERKALSRNIFKKSLLPFIMTLLVFILYLVYSMNIKPVLDEGIIKIVTKTFFAIFSCLFAFLLQRITTGAIRWYLENIAIKEEVRFTNEFIPLLKKVINIAIWTITGLVVLSNFGINTSVLITTLGVSSLAITLAAQDTIANIIAGFLIMIDRPFRVGDEIKLPSGERVKVIEIGLRRSRFLNLEEKSIIIIPNLEMSKSKIVNLTYGRILMEEGGKI